MENMGAEEPLEIITDKCKKRELERLKRESDRQLEVEKRREEREQNVASNEKCDAFIESFTEKRREIDDALSALASNDIEKSQLPFHFDRIVKNIQSLQNYISSSTYFIRRYDLRKSQEAVQELQQRCVELEERLLPKKKFSFKARKTPSKSKKDTFGCKIEDCVDSASVPKAVICESTPVVEKNMTGFSGRNGEDLILKEDMILRKDVIISYLDNCTVRLLGVPSTLLLANLHNTRVLCGPVVTSVFVQDCVDCVFVLACQQMRIHNTEHCDFHLHVTSRSIIEDSKDVRFAPFILKYENADEHFQVAGLDLNRNNWDLVDDFNWLACDEPSPHWCTMKPNEQNLDWL